MTRSRENADGARLDAPLASPTFTGAVLGTPLSHRNMIINGGMQVAQRGTSGTGKTTTGFYCVDRMETVFTTLGTWTLEQSTDAPDGFSNSIKMTCTTADASPAASDFAYMRQIIEAQNLQHLKVGTSSAQPTTLSFYVKATKTGSFTLAARNFDGGTRMFSKNITVSSANTWEYKTVTIPGDTGGSIANDNGWGLEIGFWVNSGSTYSGGSEMSTWAAQDNTAKYLGTIDIGASTNDAIQFAGIQLELGSTATPFEHRSYGDELARCQRYYYLHVAGNSLGFATGYYHGTTDLGFYTHFPVSMHSAPSLSYVGGTDYFLMSNPSNDYFNAIVAIQASVTGANHYFTPVSGTVGKAGRIRTANASAKVAYLAEL
jgi:hypothetical protein